jgi:hypothetical protein
MPSIVLLVVEADEAPERDRVRDEEQCPEVSTDHPPCDTDVDDVALGHLLVPVVEKTDLRADDELHGRSDLIVEQRGRREL